MSRHTLHLIFVGLVFIVLAMFCIAVPAQTTFVYTDKAMVSKEPLLIPIPTHIILLQTKHRKLVV